MRCARSVRFAVTCFVALSAAGSVASAATYYVSPSGDDAGAGSVQQPWRSLHKAAATLQAGDTAVFEDGEYVETSTIEVARGGTAGTPIVYRARNRHKARLSWRSVGNESKFVTRHPYVTIQDFEITQDVMGPDTGDVLVRGWRGGDHFRVIGNRIHNAQIGVKSHAGVDQLIEGNVVYDTSGIDPFNVDGAEIRFNEVYGMHGKYGGYGITPKGGSRNVRIHDNFIHGAEAEAGIFLGGVSCAQGCEVYDPAGYEGYGIVAWNNVVVSETRGGIRDGIRMVGCRDCAAFHNVVMGAATGLGTMMGGSNDWVRRPPCRNPVFANNIVVGATSSALSLDDVEGSAQHDHNLFFDSVGVPVEANGVRADPRFVNAATDWRLVPGSPAIDAGKVVTFVDFAGASVDLSLDRAGRRREGNWDIGAYELAGLAVDGGAPGDGAAPPDAGVAGPTGAGPTDAGGSAGATGSPSAAGGAAIGGGGEATPGRTSAGPGGGSGGSAPASASRSGCSFAAAPRASASSLLFMLGWCASLRRRRRRRGGRT